MSTITFSEKEVKETLNIREQLDAVFRLLTMKEILIMPQKKCSFRPYKTGNQWRS